MVAGNPFKTCLISGGNGRGVASNSHETRGSPLLRTISCYVVSSPDLVALVLVVLGFCNDNLSQTKVEVCFQDYLQNVPGSSKGPILSIQFLCFWLVVSNIFFIFILFGEMMQFDSNFWDGLKPPTGINGPLKGSQQLQRGPRADRYKWSFFTAKNMAFFEWVCLGLFHPYKF